MYLKLWSMEQASPQPSVHSAAAKSQDRETGMSEDRALESCAR